MTDQQTTLEQSPLPTPETAPESAPKQSPQSFESALQTLENIVQQMEQGELSLDESLQHFEQGVQLTRYCQTILHDAEQRISTLMADGTTEVYSPPNNR